MPPGTISDKPGLDAVNLFRAMEDGRVQAALLMCTNPAQSLPAADRYRAGMEKCFLAVADIFADSETARLADVVLPAALWIEKEGCTGQGEWRYQLTEKLLEPPGQARSDLHILVDLADRLGHGALLGSPGCDPGVHHHPGLYTVSRAVSDGCLHLHRTAAVCAGDVGLCAKGLARFAEP